MAKVTFKEFASKLKSRQPAQNISPEEKEYRKQLSKTYQTRRATEQGGEAKLSIGTQTQQFKEYQRKARERNYERLNKGYARQDRYAESRSGRFAGRLATALNFIRSPARSLSTPSIPLGRKFNRQTTYGRSVGKAGRPVGTYNKMYAQYGGVYGWRKAMAQQRRIQQLEYLRSMAQTPGQRAAFQSIEARRMAEIRNMEAQPIPVTQGNVPLRGLMDEIDAATNIYP